MKMVTTRGLFKKTTLFATAFILAVSSLTAAVPFILSQRAGAVSTPYSQSFEAGNDWTSSTVVGDGADGFASSDGTHYARMSSGAFTRWGGYNNVFPEYGYSTSIDLFLYMNTATGNGTDLRVDYSSAVNNQSGTHLRDFIFHLGTDPTTANQWLVNVSNNSPGNPSAANNLAITQDGWYTLKHDFKNKNGVLEVTLSVIKKADGSVLKSWVLSTPSDLISSVVGGNRYGWFTGNRFDIPYVAIDNAKRTVNDAPATTTQVVTGNTSAGENQPGWMFNRDASTTTPFSFNGGNAVLGLGSIDVAPIAASPASNKFIAENFILSPLEDVTKISVDYKLKDATPANQVYMNVYVNYGSSPATKFYDCRYNVWATAGSNTSFSTLTFDVNGSYDVTTRGGASASPHTCPSTPSAMNTQSPGATIRAYSFSVGDTSASDAGFSAYFDKSVVKKTDAITVYDFEPVAPATPANLRLNGNQPCGYITNVNFITPTWDAVSDAVSYNYKVTLPDGSTYGPTNVGNVTSVSGAFGGEGLSTFSVQAVAANGLTSDWAPACAVTYDATAPGVPTLQSPADNAYQNVNDFYFNWSDVAGASGYEFQASQSSTVNGEGSLANGVWQGDYQGVQPTESQARSVGASGTWYWQVRSVDAAGNKSAWTAPWKLTIDNVAPAAPVLSLRTAGGAALTSGGATNSLNVVADWNDVSDANSYIYKYWNSIPGNPYTSANPYTVNGLGNSTQSGSFTEGQGTHYIQVFAVDAAGNVSAGSNVFEITYDTGAPSSTNNLPDVVNGTVQVTQVITDNFAAASGKLRIWKLVNGVQDNTQFYATPNVTADANGNVVYSLDSIANLYGDGQYIAKFTSTDKAGNATVAEKTFTVDNTAPAVTINALQDDTTSPLITGTAGPDAVRAFVTVNQETPVEVPVTNGTWTYDRGTPFAAGTYTISVVAEDALGNRTATPAEGTLTITPVDDEADGETVTNNGGTTSNNGGTTGGTAGTAGTTPQTPVAVLVPAITSPASALGATTDTTANEEQEGEVEGVSTLNSPAQAVNSEANQGTFLGLGWYWWLLIIAALAAIGWWIGAAVRGRNTQG